MSYAKSYSDLKVYKAARDLAQTTYLVSREFPKDEKFSLTDQIRRSSRSIGAQIAEAWAKRRYQKHFISKLTDADGEQMETVHWLEIAVDCGYLNPADAKQAKELCFEIGKMINSMIEKSESFCTPSGTDIKYP